MGFVANGHTSDVISFLLASALVSTGTKNLIIRPFMHFPYCCSEMKAPFSDCILELCRL